MPQKIYTFSLDLTMKLMQYISKIDRFDAAWTTIEKREGQSLKQLKAIATVRSVGASTRIEGSKMTDDEVEVLIDKLKVAKLEERDQQEVAGYFDALNVIGESYKDIDITEGNLKNLHKILMSYNEKDSWHRGNYKQVSNAVEASHTDGSKQIVFNTTEPGFETEEAMKGLIHWYDSDNETIPLVKVAAFIYDFLSIHPFQDGNGRLSRLLGTLLLLKNGYSWIQYISFEHEIENRKTEYYRVLMQTQQQRPGEKIDEWLVFFLDCMMNIQELLMEKLKIKEKNSSMTPKEKTVLSFIENRPGTKSSEISKNLNIPLPTVKRMLNVMVERKLVSKYGVGSGTNYVVENQSTTKTGLMFQLTNTVRKKEFTLVNEDSFIEIIKIILTPLFKWEKPDDWSKKLIDHGLSFKITGYTSKGGSFSDSFPLISFNNPMYYEPKLNLVPTISIPESITMKTPKMNEFPIRILIEIMGSVSQFEFDVMFVYNERNSK